LATDRKNWLPFMKYCHENGAWAGEDWDPNDVDDNDDADGGERRDHEWEVVDGGPSPAAVQEAGGFVRREE